MTEGTEYRIPPINGQLPPLGTEFTIPLNTLFTQVFGIASGFIRRYNIPPEEKQNNDKTYEIGKPMSQPVRQDEIKSVLGTPINFWMQFVGRTYNKRDKGEIKQVTLESMYLPFASVATFTRAKRYTETFMSGQKGSVIEEYGFEPWDIRIQGFILKDYGTIESQVQALERYENLSDAIEVKGRVFEWLDIHEIAFTSIDYKPTVKADLESILPFEIKARSVEPLPLVF